MSTGDGALSSRRHVGPEGSSLPPQTSVSLSYNGSIWVPRGFCGWDTSLPRQATMQGPYRPRRWSRPGTLPPGTLTGLVASRALLSHFCSLQKPPPKMQRTLGHPNTDNARALRMPGEQNLQFSAATPHQIRARAQLGAQQP